MNKVLLKQTSILSLILGAILGVISIIPYVGILSFIAEMFLAGAIVLTFMKKNDFLGRLTPRDGGVYGAFIGFTSFIGFSITFVPIATILGLFIKDSYYMGVSMLFRIGFIVLVMMVFFVAILSALMNAFSGLAAVYFNEQLLNEEEQTETFNIES